MRFRRVWYSFYRLFPLKRLSSASLNDDFKRGALLKFEFQDGLVGYADCHPLVERGYGPIQSQLKLLSQFRTTAVTENSVQFARFDAEARGKNENLFKGLLIPKSHYLDTSLLDSTVRFQTLLHRILNLEKEGFRRIKLKNFSPLRILSFLEKLAERLPKGFLLRLDCNSAAPFREILEFAEKASTCLKKSLEFIEDPCPYQAKTWKAFVSKLSIALDFEKVKNREILDSIKYEVLKPAYQLKEIFNPRKVHRPYLIVTSSMDHPVGQMFAAWTAANCRKKFSGRLKDCGLLTHSLFENNPYSDALKTCGPFLFPAEGNGIGFDELLRRERWKRLL